MEENFTNIAKKQLEKLPQKIQELAVAETTEKEVDEISRTQGLSSEQTTRLGTEVFLLLLGLTSPKEFSQIIKERLGLNEVTRKTLIKELEDKILEPIYPDLVRFYEQEQVERAKLEAEVKEGGSKQVEINAPKEVSQKQEVTPTPEPKGRQWEKAPDIAPDNLPTEQEFMLEQNEDSYIPKLTPKTIPQTFEPQVITPEEAPHPFEEKMQKVFTAGTPAMENLEIADEPREKPAAKIEISKPAVHDPYREPIE